MIVDSSAILSILLHEPDAESLQATFLDHSHIRMSAASFLEVAMRIIRKTLPDAVNLLDEFVARMDIRIEPITAEQARIARDAFARYGKGMGHPAQLNFGDCFTYALARVTGEPLLHKGNDFNHTDLMTL